MIFNKYKNIMAIDRDEILDKLEEIQNDVDAQGFMGSNENDLWRREAIADYIEKLTVMHSSLQLKDRYKIDFDFWLTKKFVKQGDLYYPINGSMLMSENEVLEIYKDEVLDL